jgi:inhibitor of KinA
MLHRIYAIHDQAITIEFSQEISEDANMRVIEMKHAIESNPFKGFIECVPAYASLTVYFNDQISALDVRAQMMNFYDTQSEIIKSGATTNNKQTIIIPVCYDPALGVDLPWVSNHLNLSEEEIISLHSSIAYRVFMIGFIPGFPYMGTLPQLLELPRKQTPSMKIPMGSVAIAGKQTGIYPAEVPGGWHVIGRTPLKMFDKTKEPCCFLKAGDFVQFKSISLEEFNQYS